MMRYEDINIGDRVLVEMVVMSARAEKREGGKVDFSVMVQREDGAFRSMMTVSPDKLTPAPPPQIDASAWTGMGRR